MKSLFRMLAKSIGFWVLEIGYGFTALSGYFEVEDLLLLQIHR
jgi:hypothetical protein